MTITIKKYAGETIKFSDLLDRYGIGLDICETVYGQWYARLVGAELPAYTSRKPWVGVVSAKTLVSIRMHATPELALAEARYTLARRVVRILATGETVDLRQFRITE